GDESALAGQPVVDASGTPTRDSLGHVIVYTQSGTATESESETFAYTTINQKISLLAPALAGTLAVKVGGASTTQFTYSGGIVTITGSFTPEATVLITYTAGLATETKNESYSYEGAPQSI